jgi:hypothetical protein
VYQDVPCAQTLDLSRAERNTQRAAIDARLAAQTIETTSTRAWR